jgi:peroxiredoxin
MKKRFILMLLSILLVAAACQQKKVKEGQPAPDFAVETLSGVQLQFSRLQGQYLLLEFWSTNCEACRANHPQIMRLRQRYHNANFKLGDQFNVIGIALNSDERAYRRIIREDDLQYRHYIMQQSPTENMFDASLAKLYGVTALPAYFLIDGNGTVIGSDIPLDELEPLLKSEIK